MFLHSTIDIHSPKWCSIYVFSCSLQSEVLHNTLILLCNTPRPPTPKSAWLLPRLLVLECNLSRTLQSQLAISSVQTVTCINSVISLIWVHPHMAQKVHCCIYRIFAVSPPVDLCAYLRNSQTQFGVYEGTHFLARYQIL